MDKNEELSVVPVIKEKKAGRPSKAELAATRKRGRPKNDTGRLAELKARLLATKGDYVVDKVLQIALDDNHPGQMAALKLCLDRMLPISMFEKGAGGKPSIQINITNATAPEDSVTIDVGEVTDVDVD